MRMERNNRRSRNAINQQALRLREKNNMLSWFSKVNSDVNNAKRDRILQSLTSVQTAAGTRRASSSASPATALNSLDNDALYPTRPVVTRNDPQGISQDPHRVPVDPEQLRQAGKRPLDTEPEKTYGNLDHGIVTRSTKRHVITSGLTDDRRASMLANDPSMLGAPATTVDMSVSHMNQGTSVLTWGLDNMARTEREEATPSRHQEPLVSTALQDLTTTFEHDGATDMDEADLLLGWANKNPESF